MSDPNLSMTARPETASGWTYSTPARLFSLTLASGLALLLLIYPVVVSGSGTVSHNQLMISLWGISAGFIHGIGYLPLMTVWRWSFSPWVAWGLMGLTLYWWLG